MIDSLKNYLSKKILYLFGNSLDPKELKESTK